MPFDALVDQFMSQHPYKAARRVFLIIDNGSAHRGKRSIDRLQGTWPNLIVVHTPVHASWLNQAEIYFSVVQRKVVTSRSRSRAERSPLLRQQGGSASSVATGSSLSRRWSSDGEPVRR